MLTTQIIFDWANAITTENKNYTPPKALIKNTAKYIVVVSEGSPHTEVIGDIVVLSFDDGTSCPCFRCVNRLAYGCMPIYWFQLSPYFE